ncbi:MAG: hypothetical protein P4L46_18780 [Fimbriimonas sp.]|nr:hypothetical protein [Fimbriimonas sp.]
MSFVRTVLSDVPSDCLGYCYSHEHIVLRGEYIEDAFPDFNLTDMDAICHELIDLRECGVCTMIDAMPTDAGRSVADLVEASRRTGMHIVASTGLHLRQYYPPVHWYDTIPEDDLFNRMVVEIEMGMTDPGSGRSPSRAGVTKVAGSLDRLTDLEVRNFRAAGRAQALTGCPILTHTERGTAALEQIQILKDAGADLEHVALSHLDQKPDIDYHREVLQSGVKLEFDSSFRWKGDPNHTLELLIQLAPEYPRSFLLGMDAAKPRYWSSFGGEPGLTFLIGEFASRLLDQGLDRDLVRRFFVENPAETYSFGR